MWCECMQRQKHRSEDKIPQCVFDTPPPPSLSLSLSQVEADELAEKVAAKVFDLAGGIGAPPTLQ